MQYSKTYVHVIRPLKIDKTKILMTDGSLMKVESIEECSKGMNRKYHNHKLQTNPWHCEEEQRDIYSNKTSKRQYKQSSNLSLPRQDECKTRKDIK